MSSFLFCGDNGYVYTPKVAIRNGEIVQSPCGKWTNKRFYQKTPFTERVFLFMTEIGLVVDFSTADFISTADFTSTADQQ